MNMGYFEGVGIYTFKNGLGWYEGEWYRDLFHGEGIRHYSNGTEYEGEFTDGEMSGKGTMIYANGDKYIGKLAFKS
jgi:hypothetical protein